MFLRVALGPLDVGFNGLWKILITSRANKWLAETIRAQLALNPDPTKVVLNTKKSALVEPFCDWIAAATIEMKAKPELIRRSWEKTGVLVAWQVGEERNKLLAEATTLHAQGHLWAPTIDKKHKNGTVPRTRMVCHGGLEDLGNQAAVGMGGFGDVDGAEDQAVDEPDDVGLMEEQPAAADEDELEKEPEEKKGSKKKKKKKKKSEDEDEEEEDDENERDQLPDALAAQFQAKATRSGRQIQLPKKFRT